MQNLLHSILVKIGKPEVEYHHHFRFLNGEICPACLLIACEHFYIVNKQSCIDFSRARFDFCIKSENTFLPNGFNKK